MSRHLAALALGLAGALLAALAFGVPARAQSPGAVTGRVVNLTAGAAVPEGLEVYLHVYAGEEAAGVYPATVDADGAFTIPGYVPTAGQRYFALTEHLGVAYYTEVLSVASAGDPGEPLRLAIAETTTDPSGLSIAQMHLFIDGSGSELQVAEYYAVANAGDATYVGEPLEPGGAAIGVHIPLPEEARDVRPLEIGAAVQYVETPRGLGVAEPVRPGAAALEPSFGYVLPYRSGMVLRRSADLPVGSLVIVVSAPGLVLEGEGVAPGRSMEGPTGTVHTYSGGPLSAGEVVALRLTGALPADAAPTDAPTEDATRRPSPAADVAIGAVALAAGAAAALAMWRGGGAPAPPPAVRPLVQELADLEARREAGAVALEDYRRRAATLRRRIEEAIR